MYGLSVVGVLLMLGLFTRLAAIGGIAFLLLFYLCNPPFVGYFYAIPTEGSYLIVNKNLVELCALVVILVTGSGRFAGLDGILHRLFVRLRRTRLATA
jgi:thiosulfate dehydrogenase (quinone) large subunit